MSGSPTFDTPKKEKTERGEFTTPPRPTGRRSNKQKGHSSRRLGAFDVCVLTHVVLRIHYAGSGQ